jgi:hypothetical protein
MKRAIVAVLWIALGFGIAAVSTGRGGTVQAQQQVQNQMRLQVTFESHALSFIKDTKSGGCWIGAIRHSPTESSGWAGIATAPPEACQ